MLLIFSCNNTICNASGCWRNLRRTTMRLATILFLLLVFLPFDSFAVFQFNSIGGQPCVLPQFCSYPEISLLTTTTLLSASSIITLFVLSQTHTLPRSVLCLWCVVLLQLSPPCGLCSLCPAITWKHTQNPHRWLASCCSVCWSFVALTF